MGRSAALVRIVHQNHARRDVATTLDRTRFGQVPFHRLARSASVRRLIASYGSLVRTLGSTYLAKSRMAITVQPSSLRYFMYFLKSSGSVLTHGCSSAGTPCKQSTAICPSRADCPAAVTDPHNPVLYRTSLTGQCVSLLASPDKPHSGLIWTSSAIRQPKSARWCRATKASYDTPTLWFSVSCLSSSWPLKHDVLEHHMEHEPSHQQSEAEIQCLTAEVQDQRFATTQVGN